MFVSSDGLQHADLPTVHAKPAGLPACRVRLTPSSTSHAEESCGQTETHPL